MADLTKTVDGKALPREKFAMVLDPNDPSTWHLPIDDDHVGSAVKMFGHETHGSAEQKKAAARKIAAAAKAKGIDVSDFERKHVNADEHAEPHDYSGGWIEIFRAGDYSGQGKAKITREDLARVVNDYDPQYHEAPVCIGHPESDLPAYAWIDRVKLNGDVLLAREKQVDPDFAEMRKAGKFKKRSAAFYRRADGNIAGLRHVGWLGAQPPVVKGLRDVAFDDHGMSYLEIEFEEEKAVAEKTVKDQIAEFFAEMFGKKQASGTFSEDDVKRIAAEAVTAATKPLTDQVTALKTDLAAQSTRFSERETALATSETKQRAIAAENKLKAAGCWVPAYEKAGLPVLFAELAKAPGTLEFGEGAEKKQLAPLDLLVAFMESQGKIVPAGRIVHAAPAKRQGAGTGDPLTDAAKTRAAEKKITFSEALDQVVAENPELALAGAGSAGAV